MSIFSTGNPSTHPAPSSSKKIKYINIVSFKKTPPFTTKVISIFKVPQKPTEEKFQNKIVSKCNLDQLYIKINAHCGFLFKTNICFKMSTCVCSASNVYRAIKVSLYLIFDSFIYFSLSRLSVIQNPIIGFSNYPFSKHLSLWLYETAEA